MQNIKEHSLHTTKIVGLTFWNKYLVYLIMVPTRFYENNCIFDQCGLKTGYNITLW